MPNRFPDDPDRETLARPSRPRAIAAVGAALTVLATLAFAWHVAPAADPMAPGGPMLEEAIVLRCLSPGEAAEVVRPHLRLRTNIVVSAPAQAPRVLTVRGTPAQLEHVKAVLGEHERAGSPACTAGAMST